MKYMGSKARHAKDILSIILSSRKPGQHYVEPFVGGGNTICLVDGLRIGNDQNQKLIALFKALQNGWRPPICISREDYQAVRLNQDKFAPEIVAFIGFACSFSGKWFGGYAAGGFNRGGPRDHSKEAYRNVLKQSEGLKGVSFYSGSYDDLQIPPESLIYCDPPYRGTTGYGGNGFDHDKFWSWCEMMDLFGHTVFVSEYAAPSNWVCVWEKKCVSTLDKTAGLKTTKNEFERLFALRDINKGASQPAPVTP